MKHPPPSFDWRPVLFNMVVLSCALCTLLMAFWSIDGPRVAGLIFTATPTLTPSATATSMPTFTATLPPTHTPSPAPPTPTNTPVIRPTAIPALHIPQQSAAASINSTITPTEQAAVPTSPTRSLQNLLQEQSWATQPRHVSSNINRSTPLVLAHYFAWFDDVGWDDCNISARDKPLQPYHSDDPMAIARHVSQAQQVGLDGFTLHWFIPGDRTDRNFRTLLMRSEGQPFYSSIVFSRHIYHGAAATRASIVEALRYIIAEYGPHANFLHLGQKPVIFFTDVYRVPSGGQTGQQFWQSVRAEIDPQRQTVWIAEGLDFSYLSVFDGIYVFKITHATAPHDYQKSNHWAEQVRQWEQRTGEPKLWLATFSPGWDDMRAGCRADVRVPAPAHRVERGKGAFFRATFEAALNSNPDWLLLGSFNEWVEGSYIEPSVAYGDTYMQLTESLVQQFKRQR